MTFVEIETSQPVNAAIIWLHGLGGDGNDLVQLVPLLTTLQDLAIRFIFPNAPQMPVTINNGHVMGSWFDILEIGTDGNRVINLAHFKTSVAAISRLVDQQVMLGIPAERIIIAGYSQGGAVAYQVALTYKQPLAGLVAISTYFATADIIEPHVANKNLRIGIFHGCNDNAVSEVLARISRQKLENMQHAVEYFTYDVDHAMCMYELEDISNFICRALINTVTTYYPTP